MGFLYQNLLTELRKQTKKANGGKKQKQAKDTVEDVREDEVVEEPAEGDGAEEEVDASASDDRMPGRSGERNRLAELQNLGLGEKSFSYVSPFSGRKTGLTARMQASQDNRKAQEQYTLKGKSCLKCGKQFVDGALLKSRVIKCQSCEGFVHEKSGRCSVNLTRGNPVSYKCPTCSEELEAGKKKLKIASVSALISTVVTLGYCSCCFRFNINYHIGNIHIFLHTNLSLYFTF